jgi:hypothetical protein
VIHFLRFGEEEATGGVIFFRQQIFGFSVVVNDEDLSCM